VTRERGDLLVPVAVGLATAVLHLATAPQGGIFRDELYYLACAEHLDFGYVDHPPLIAVVTWLVRHTLGTSLLALRFLPAMAAGATVFLTGCMVRELGGDRRASLLAGGCVALAPVYLGTFGILTMNAFDVLVWTAILLAALHALRTGEARWWLVVGLLAGVGLQNKISVLFLGFGLAVGLVVARDWRHLRSGWLWAGGALALAIFLPHLVWQQLHGWPTLEFIANATQNKNLPLSPLAFLGSQVLQMNPLTAPLWVGGLVVLLLAPRTRPHRALGWTFLAVLLVMVSQQAKAYYLAPIYPMLYAAGAVGLSTAAHRPRWRWVPAALTALVAVAGGLLVPLGKPVLPVETYLRYAARVGEGPSSAERHEVGRLPQFFADRRGWPELALAVAEVHRALPPEDRSRACVFGQNYGQAGAIDLFGGAYGLPKAISGHNSYWLWGPGDCTGEVVIVIGGRREDLVEVFEEVRPAARYTCDDCMPYEDDKPIWVCRRMRWPIEEVWPRVRGYG